MATLKVSENPKVVLTETEFDSVNNVFVLFDKSKSTQLSFFYPLKPIASIKEDYEIFLLTKKDIPNNDIFQLYEKNTDKRIGWIFPLVALITTEHDYAENEHFLPYAYSAFQLLVLEGNYEVDDSGSFKSSDYFNSFHLDTVIVCLSKEVLLNNLNQLPRFRFKEYLPSLYRYGYVAAKSNLKSDYDLETKKRVNISPISKSFINDNYVKELYTNLISEDHPLIKFHVLYQIIELCLDKILVNELTKLTQGIKAKEIYVRELRQQLTTFEGEQERLRKLFENYLKNTDNFPKSDLKSLCKIFLNNCKISYQQSLNESDLLYKVRNSVVHNYRNIFQKGDKELQKINDILSHCVSEILINFNEQ